MNNIVHSAAALADTLYTCDSTYILIDGFPGSGKTTLGDELSRLLSKKILHLDEYLQPHTGRYFDALNVSRLKDEFILNRSLIIEGVCALRVLVNLSLGDEVTIIYCENLADEFDIFADHSPLAQELSMYHAEFDPRQRADYIFQIHQPRAPLARKQGSSNTMSNREDVDIAYLNAKTRLAITIAIGGIIALLVGLGVLLYGTTTQDATVIKTGYVEFSASGIGAIIMATSSIWAYFSYKCRPGYTQGVTSSENYGEAGRLASKIHHRWSTEMIVDPNHKRDRGSGPPDGW